MPESYGAATTPAFSGPPRSATPSASPFRHPTAPQLSVHVYCTAAQVLHLEYFHDHVRIDKLVIEGAIEPEGGALQPDRGSPGIGLAPKEQDAEEYRVY